MKKLFAILGVIGLLCGCHTSRNENTGGTSTSYDNSTGYTTNNMSSTNSALPNR